MFHAYRADFLKDRFLKKSKFFIAKMKKKKIDLFESQCTFSNSSPQAELKYIIPDQRKSFHQRVQLLLRHVHYHKQVKYVARTSVACMILVKDMTFSMLLKTNHTSPINIGDILGLGII